MGPPGNAVPNPRLLAGAWILSAACSSGLPAPQPGAVYSAMSAGTGRVTSPVAAHSEPRTNVTSKPRFARFSGAWPRAVMNTRPVP